MRLRDIHWPSASVVIAVVLSLAAVLIWAPEDARQPALEGIALAGTIIAAMTRGMFSGGEK